MIDARKIAQGILGTIKWENEVSGFCRCPGEGLHSEPIDIAVDLGAVLAPLPEI
jgi:hypothetical protein